MAEPRTVGELGDLNRANKVPAEQYETRFKEQYGVAPWGLPVDMPLTEVARQTLDRIVKSNLPQPQPTSQEPDLESSMQEAIRKATAALPQQAPQLSPGEATEILRGIEFPEPDVQLSPLDATRAALSPPSYSSAKEAMAERQKHVTRRWVEGSFPDIEVPTAGEIAGTLAKQIPIVKMVDHLTSDKPAQAMESLLFPAVTGGKEVATIGPRVAGTAWGAQVELMKGIVSLATDGDIAEEYEGLVAKSALEGLGPEEQVRLQELDKTTRAGLARFMQSVNDDIEKRVAENPGAIGVLENTITDLRDVMEGMGHLFIVHLLGLDPSTAEEAALNPIDASVAAWNKGWGMGTDLAQGLIAQVSALFGHEDGIIAGIKDSLHARPATTILTIYPFLKAMRGRAVQTNAWSSVDEAIFSKARAARDAVVGMVKQSRTAEKFSALVEPAKLKAKHIAESAQNTVQQWLQSGAMHANPMVADLLHTILRESRFEGGERNVMLARVANALERGDIEGAVKILPPEMVKRVTEGKAPYEAPVLEAKRFTEMAPEQLAKEGEPQVIRPRDLREPELELRKPTKREVDEGGAEPGDRTLLPARQAVVETFEPPGSIKHLKHVEVDGVPLGDKVMQWWWESVDEVIAPQEVFQRGRFNPLILDAKGKPAPVVVPKEPIAFKAKTKQANIEAIRKSFMNKFQREVGTRPQAIFERDPVTGKKGKRLVKFTQDVIAKHPEVPPFKPGLGKVEFTKAQKLQVERGQQIAEGKVPTTEAPAPPVKLGAAPVTEHAAIEQAFKMSKPEAAKARRQQVAQRNEAKISKALKFVREQPPNEIKPKMLERVNELIQETDNTVVKTMNSEAYNNAKEGGARTMAALKKGEKVDRPPAVIEGTPAEFIAKTEKVMTDAQKASPDWRFVKHQLEGQKVGERWTIGGYEPLDAGVAKHIGAKTPKEGPAPHVPRQFNRTMKWHIKAKDASANQGDILKWIKAGMTTQSFKSLVGNTLSDTFYDILTTANPARVTELVAHGEKFNNWRTGKAVAAEDARAFKNVSHVIDSDMVAQEIGKTNEVLTNIAEHLPSKTLVKGAKKHEQFKRASARLYQGQSNLYKTRWATREFKQIDQYMKAMEDGTFIEGDVAPGKTTMMVKKGDGWVDGKGRKLTQEQVDKIIGRMAGERTFRRYVDYGDPGNFAKFVRAHGTAGIAAPFFTWAIEAMPFPGKSSIPGQTFKPRIPLKTDSRAVRRLEFQAATERLTRQVALVNAAISNSLGNEDLLHYFMSYGNRKDIPKILYTATNPAFVWEFGNAPQWSVYEPMADVVRLAQSVGSGVDAVVNSIGDPDLHHELKELYTEMDSKGVINWRKNAPPEVMKRRRAIFNMMTNKYGTSWDHMSTIKLMGGPLQQIIQAGVRGQDWGGRALEFAAKAFFGSTAVDIASGLGSKRKLGEEPLGPEHERVIRATIRATSGLGWRPHVIEKQGNRYFDDIRAAWNKQTGRTRIRKEIKGLKAEVQTRRQAGKPIDDLVARLQVATRDEAFLGAIIESEVNMMKRRWHDRKKVIERAAKGHRRLLGPALKRQRLLGGTK